ncbi:GNAT family N-acetyltransferase [Streptomyces sp. NPDC007100]|uniref:GNAT family N-acetyltransferase n=1 Tax=Streptomyces sp. NPDC007100 TaxID=3155602 RepID=UPI0033E309A1
MNLPIDNPPIDTAGSHSTPLPAAHRDTVRTWVYGWARCRGTATPVAVPGGFHIDIGLPEHAGRYVLPAADPGLLRGLAASITVPNLWIKVCAPREEIAPLLPPAWEFAEPQFLMSAALPVSAGPVVPPPGYLVETADKDGTGVIDCRVLDAATGEPAAWGRAALTHASAPPSAVYDKINTAPAHRRRGLGSLLMHALTAYAVRLGATHGILVASPAGRSLYRSLGWQYHAPLTAARIPSPPKP